MDEGDIELYPCKCCGRNFRSDVLRKHEPICIKSNKKQRKIFDSGKQRAQGSDIPINKTLKPGEIPKPDPKTASAEAKTKQWRQKHEMLINSLKAARNYAVAKTSGGPLPPPPPPVIDTSLVQCPYCQRRFNEEASTRHISFCKEQKAKLAPRSNANKKPAYKPPALKPKQPAPSQSNSSITSNGIGSQAQKQIPNPTTKSVPSSSLPVKSAVKSSLPTRNVVGRQQQPSPGMNAPQSINASMGNTRIGSYNNSAARTSIQPPTAATPGSGLGPRTGIRKPTTTTTTAATRSTAFSNTNNKPTAFCHECGASFTIASARFCSECGVRRLAV